MTDSTKTRTIDATPTWRGILPALLLAYTDGTGKGRAMALGELQRMADIADDAVAAAKAEAAAAKVTGEEPASPPPPDRPTTIR